MMAVFISVGAVLRPADAAASCTALATAGTTRGSKIPGTI